MHVLKSPKLEGPLYNYTQRTYVTGYGLGKFHAHYKSVSSIALCFPPSTSIESGPVSDLELNSVNDTTLLISWGEPVSPNGNILSYSITITDLRDNSTVRSEMVGNTTYMELNLGRDLLT